MVALKLNMVTMIELGVPLPLLCVVLEFVLVLMSNLGSRTEIMRLLFAALGFVVVLKSNMLMID